MFHHYKEIVRISVGGGFFCLMRAIDIHGQGLGFAFAWRGNRKTPEGFIPKPPIFDLVLLGRILSQAFDEGKITEDEWFQFLQKLEM